MIVTEDLTINGKHFVKTYSDSGYMVECDGAIYHEAVDPSELNRKYTETDTPIESEELIKMYQKARAYDIVMGGV